VRRYASGWQRQISGRYIDPMNCARSRTGSRGIDQPGALCRLQFRQHRRRLAVAFNDTHGLGQADTKRARDQPSHRVIAPIGIADTQYQALSHARPPA
jgi:hypothetical protein